MTIDWMTVVFEVINFALLVLIAIRFVYRPIAKILDQRKAEYAARAQETAEREIAAVQARTRFEAELARIDETAEQRVNAALAEAREEAERIIAEARAEARGELDKAEAEVESARRRTLERFRGEVLRLGAEAARRVVGEIGSPEVGLAFARRAAHALADATGNGRALDRVEVQHSPELDADALARLLHEELGAAVELQMRVDEELIGGVRLHAGGYEIDASAGSSLDGWYRSIVGAAA